MVLFTRSTQSSGKLWYIDSGASHHVTGQLDGFENYVNVRNQQVTVASGERLSVSGMGNVRIFLGNGGKVLLRNVWYVPGVKENLISLVQLMDGGVEMYSKDK